MTRSVLLVALCGVAAPPVYGSSHYGRTAANIRVLSRACEVFREECGSYPAQEAWLDQLKAKDRQSSLLVDHEHTLDAWGNPFVYVFPGKRNPESFDLYSLGADGKTETNGDDPDDISNWHAPERWRKHYKPSKISKLHLLLLTGLAISVFLLARARRKMLQT